MLEYLAPRDGRPIPLDARANDLVHWQTLLVTANAAATGQRLRARKFSFVSSGLVALPEGKLGFKKGKVEDLDFARRLIFVRRSVSYGKLQAPKSDSSVRVLPMPEVLAARLQEYLKTWRLNPQGLLFATRRGTPFNANNVVQRKLWPRTF